jgi:hypothetical protein
MDGEIRTGDVIVCRVNGTLDLYVVGIVLSGKVGEILAACRLDDAWPERSARKRIPGANARSAGLASSLLSIVLHD